MDVFTNKVIWGLLLLCSVATAGAETQVNKSSSNMFEGEPGLETNAVVEATMQNLQQGNNYADDKSGNYNENYEDPEQYYDDSEEFTAKKSKHK